jgi:hypothetical protein
MIDDEIFEHITIEPKSNYPVSGGDEKENTFVINYKLFGIIKSFETKSKKNLLTIEDIQAEILGHEARDHINNTMCKKPPLGITPHFIWIEQRIEEIKEAINRRIEAKENIPHEWYIELAQLENERIANTTHLEINIPQEQFNNLKTDIFSNSPMPNETVSEYFERRVKQRYLTN